MLPLAGVTPFFVGAAAWLIQAAWGHNDAAGGLSSKAGGTSHCSLLQCDSPLLCNALRAKAAA